MIDGNEKTAHKYVRDPDYNVGESLPPCGVCRLSYATHAEEDAKRREEIAAAPIEKALKLIWTYGAEAGEHHKQWLIDQIVRALTRDGYDQWVEVFKAGEDGPYTYEWDRGIAP